MLYRRIACLSLLAGAQAAVTPPNRHSTVLASPWWFFPDNSTDAKVDAASQGSSPTWKPSEIAWSPPANARNWSGSAAQPAEEHHEYGQTDGDSSKKNCTPPDPRGYLLWTGYLPEFNNQLITLAETILFNRALPTPRVLVMTGFMELKDPGTSLNASDGEMFQTDPDSHVLHKVAFALDVAKTIAEFPGTGREDWISPEDLANVCEMRANAHAFIHYFELPPTLPQGRMSYTRSPYKVQEKIWHGEGAPHQGHPIKELDALGIKFSTANITVHDSQDVLYMHQLPDGKESPMLIMDYLFYSQHNVHPAYADTAYETFDMIGKFHWSKVVQETSASFRRTYFGGTDVKFIALHWRRGYHVAKAGENNADSGDISYSHAGVAKILKRRSERGCSGCPIYIASNNITMEDIDEVKSLMGTGQTVMSLMINPPNVDLNTLSRSEMAICKTAHIFIPSASSTWSATVMAQRGMHISGPPAPTSLSEGALEEFALNDGLGYEPHAYDRLPSDWRHPDWTAAAARAPLQHDDLDKKVVAHLHDGETNGDANPTKL